MKAEDYKLEYIDANGNVLPISDLEQAKKQAMQDLKNAGVESKDLLDEVTGAETADEVRSLTASILAEHGIIVDRAVSDDKGKVLLKVPNILKDYEIREVESTKFVKEFTPDKYKISGKVGKISYQDFKDHYNSIPAGASKDYDLKISDKEAKQLFLNVKPFYGKLIIDKVDASKQPLERIHFELSGISASNKDFKEDKYTDSKGHVEFTKLPEGDYVLKELPVEAGLKVDSGTALQSMEPIKFTIDKDKQVVDYSGEKAIVNDKVQLLINKVAVSAVADIPAQEEIYDFTNTNRKLLPGFKFKLTELDDKSKVIETELTDENGAVLVQNLKADTFYEISEVDTQDEQYKHNDKTYIFKIVVNRDTSEIQLLDKDGRRFRQDILNFANAPKDKIGKLVISKTDDNGKALAGAEFALYEFDEDGQTILRDKGLTDAEGKLEFSELPFGKYLVKELQAPEGYILDAREVEITIDKPEQVIEKTFKNSKEPEPSKPSEPSKPAETTQPSEPVKPAETTKAGTETTKTPPSKTGEAYTGTVMGVIVLLLATAVIAVVLIRRRHNKLEE